MKYMANYFTEKEDLLLIIKSIIPNPKNIKKYSTGWTNIVLEVTNDNNESFIFRFPRNDFFSKQIEKDVIACNFLKEKIKNFKTINPTIYFDKNNRPFSMHKKVEGETLTNKINSLNDSDKNRIIKEIATFFAQVHSIEVIEKDIQKELTIRLSKFLNDLAKVDDNYYDYSMQKELEEDENSDKLVFVHGDLNIGNIILNESNDIVAFIDFAFFGLSDIYLDLSRISCRVDDVFLDKLIEEYEKLVNIKIDRNKIEKRNKMWKYIEEQYIEYIKNYHPEIEL